MADERAAIGIFDSGVGGLTVFRRITEALPDEGIVYLGDTARVPYGTKSAETVIRYARACARVLQEHHVKLIVAACNTASAFAVETLQRELTIPVIGVVEPGAAAAVRVSKTGRIGVIGTAGTIGSGVYTRAIHERLPGAQVYSRACPLFVPLAEEGWTEGRVPREVANIYLSELLAERIDTLVLGCTHYPLLAGVIADTAGGSVRLVDSAQETARVVQQTLTAKGLRTGTEPGVPRRTFLVSDAPETFTRIGRRFLGYDIAEAGWVDFQA